MRGPTDDATMLKLVSLATKNQALYDEIEQLRNQLADMVEENHHLSEQTERQLNYIAELEQEVADLKAALATKDMAG